MHKNNNSGIPPIEKMADEKKMNEDDEIFLKVFYFLFICFLKISFLKEKRKYCKHFCRKIAPALR